jgi:hypothetical protein
MTPVDKSILNKKSKNNYKHKLRGFMNPRRYLIIYAGYEVDNETRF